MVSSWQVDQLTEQLRQRGPGGPSGLMHRLAEAKATGASSPGGSPEQRDLKLELDELRTAFTEQVSIRLAGLFNRATSSAERHSWNSVQWL